MPTSVTGSPGTGHRLLVPVSTRINKQEVEQAGCCLKVTPSPYATATKLFTLTQYVLRKDPSFSCLRQSYSTHCFCEQQGSKAQEVWKLLDVTWVNSLLTVGISAEHRLLIIISATLQLITIQYYDRKTSIITSSERKCKKRIDRHLTVQSGHHRTIAAESIWGDCPGGTCPRVNVRTSLPQDAHILLTVWAYSSSPERKSQV